MEPPRKRRKVATKSKCPKDCCGPSANLGGKKGKSNKGPGSSNIPMASLTVPNHMNLHDTVNATGQVDAEPFSAIAATNSQPTILQHTEQPQGSHHSALNEHFSDTDSDSNSEDLDSIVNNHTASMLIGNGAHYAEPISTPIINQIPKKVQKYIWSNKYVDLSILLPQSVPDISNMKFAFSFHNSKMSILPQTNNKKINNIDSWTSAFIRFASVYTTMFPQEAPSLMKYMEIVRDLACRCPDNFLAYDQQFRMLRQTVA